MNPTKALTAVVISAVALTAPAGAAPRQFAPRVDNPWYPLLPGSVWRYRGSEDGKRLLDVVSVKHRTKLIAGVRCTVVRDHVYRNGRLAEDTTDWFAQDRGGTVWYFGEATRELDRRGHTTSTEGSWQAGRKGARPGVFMPAHPRAGQSFAQEHFKGHAEDHFKIVTLHGSVTVPFHRYRHNAMRTREWTPLEPGVIDRKYYVRGIGQVEEATVKGGNELLRLVSESQR
jgi:hypothetical protein